MLGVPKLPNLWPGRRGLDGFDPFAVLGVAPGATREEIRQAYFAQAKVYHPDRYATAELPTEVIEYLFAMARRINAAHAALKLEQKKQAARQEPVFTSAGRSSRASTGSQGVEQFGIGNDHALFVVLSIVEGRASLMPWFDRLTTGRSSYGSLRYAPRPLGADRALGAGWRQGLAVVLSLASSSASILSMRGSGGGTRSCCLRCRSWARRASRCAARLARRPPEISSGWSGCLEVQLLQESLAQGVERLQDGSRGPGCVPRRHGVGALARVERLQGAAHVVQRRVRIEADQVAGLADVLVDRAHVVDGLGELAEGVEVLLGASAARSACRRTAPTWWR